MKKYDLLVISVEPFPYGKAATNRMISYLLGIAQEKKILYLCLSGPRYDNTQVIEQNGTYLEIDYQYMGKPSLQSRPNRLYRALNLLYRYSKLYFLLLFVFNCKSILLYSSNHKLTNIICAISRLRHFYIYRDVTEIVGNNYSKSPRELLRMKIQAKKFTGLIVISKGIYDFFDNLLAQQKLLLPVLVDINRFQTSDKKEKYFFYCSGANLERDGLLDTLKGFLLFNSNNPGYILQVASALNLEDPYHSKCKKLIDSNSDCIHYLGILSSNEIPSKLSKAMILFVTPHRNYETKGFPTKLGEYLVSGTPTICSSIEDLTDVLEKNIAYMVEPNSPKAIASAIEKIVNNPIEAKYIGSLGRKFMIDKYTINSYKEKLIDFLKLN